MVFLRHVVLQWMVVSGLVVGHALIKSPVGRIKPPTRSDLIGCF